MKQLYFSELTGSVYFGDGKPFKNGKPGAYIAIGKKIDVTQSFYGVLFQKFPPGGEYLISDEDGRLLYKISIEEVKDETSDNP